MKVDVAIVGGGPGGSTISMFLKQKGISSVIIEKESFPRYHIGESMTGECGAVVRALGLEPMMDDPDNVVVKQGVAVYGKGGKNSWYVAIQGRDENWELFPQTTWQVRRSEFDRRMLEEAVTRGTTLLPGTATKPLFNDDGSVRGVTVAMNDGGLLDVESEVLVDASGLATFLAGAGVTSRKYRGNYDKQIAIFSHVEGAIRDPLPKGGDTLIYYGSKYHWAWFIPIDREVTSVGVVAPAAYFLSHKESKRDYLIRELHELNDGLKERLPEIKLVEDVYAIPNYSYQIKEFTGRGFMCIGDAHRFIDPIFSFGLFGTMKEAQLGSAAIVEYLNGANRDTANPFWEHQRNVELGLDVFEDMIDMFWEYPLPFSYFVHERYVDDLVDILAGRVFEHQPNQAVIASRKLLERERTYDVKAAPVGSRFVVPNEEDPLRRRRNWEGVPGYELPQAKST